MSNPNHDERGRFAAGSSSGAATGDHQRVSPNSERRNVGGLNVSRKVVVVAHNGADSVGTGATGGNGTGSAGARPGFRVALRPKKETTGLGRAARERVAMNEGIDRRHYPNDTADVRQRFKSRATGMR
jgi:hypothetical protein